MACLMQGKYTVWKGLLLIQVRITKQMGYCDTFVNVLLVTNGSAIVNVLDLRVNSVCQFHLQFHLQIRVDRQGCLRGLENKLIPL